jgi:serine/threonine protein phosphatase PrpC
MLRLRGTVFTHQGAVRDANEDTIAFGDWLRSAPMAYPELQTVALDQPRLALVADGMGGHAAGEVASRAVAESLVRQAALAVDPAGVAATLELANRDLFELMAERPVLRGMGTTVAGVIVSPGRVLVFNIGDSRVYAVGDGGALEQLSTDDTPGPKQPDGRTALVTSSLITQVLGGTTRPATLEPHVLERPLEPGARFLITSDGLTDLVPPAEIAAAIDAHDRESVERLFHLAMSAGGLDNLSIVLTRTVEET